jgi:hypothetical protein
MPHLLTREGEKERGREIINTHLLYFSLFRIWIQAYVRLATFSLTSFSHGTKRFPSTLYVNLVRPCVQFHGEPLEFVRVLARKKKKGRGR